MKEKENGYEEGRGEKGGKEEEEAADKNNIAFQVVSPVLLLTKAFHPTEC
jgi:hypothetical protein